MTNKFHIKNENGYTLVSFFIPGRQPTDRGRRLARPLDSLSPPGHASPWPASFPLADTHANRETKIIFDNVSRKYYCKNDDTVTKAETIIF